MSPTTGQTSRSTATEPGSGRSTPICRRSGPTSLLTRTAVDRRAYGPLPVRLRVRPVLRRLGGEPGRGPHSTLAERLRGPAGGRRLLGDPSFSERAARVRAHDDQRGSGVRSLSASRVVSPRSTASLLWLGPVFEVAARRTALDGDRQEIEQTLTFDGASALSDRHLLRRRTWPVLTCSLGWYYARRGQLEAARRASTGPWTASTNMVGSPNSSVATYVTPATTASGSERWGHPARNLLWSHAMCVLLAAEIAAASQAQVPSADLHEDKEKERAHEGNEILEGAVRAGDDQ